MEIITAADKHIAEIIELWIEFMGHHRDIDPRFPMRDEAPASFEEHLIERMKSGENLTLVALDKDSVVGFSMSRINNYAPIWEREIYGTIDTIAIKSEYRRKGIGEQMLEKIFDWFKSNNIDRIEISVAAENEVGYSFWKKHGFRNFMYRLYLDRD
ncbi:GNAT family N-acetyltransferase [Chloroflexota bacterium]